VGVYIVTQNPLDIPETIVGQLGNRVQHALRAFTVKDQKAVKSVGETFRQDNSFDVQEAVTTMGVGEALVSFLGADGIPEFVQRALILPPDSQIGGLTPDERKELMSRSPYAHYAQTLDRESAYEMLKKQREADAAAIAQQEEAEAAAKAAAAQEKLEAKAAAAAEKAAAKRGEQWKDAAGDAVRSIGMQVGRSLVRGIMGNLFGGRRR
jgi:DNA helicase HerA-like ATPase